MIAQKANILGQKLAATTTLIIQEKQSTHFEVLALYLRCLSNFQGTILLIERGLEVESKVVLRSCLETVFCLGAVVNKGPNVVSDMNLSSDSARSSFRNWIKNRPSIYENFNKENRLNFTEIQDENSKHTKLKWDDLAEKAGIQDYYVWYKWLSADAHATAQSLDRYCIPSPDNNHNLVNWGPESATQFPIILSLASNFLLIAIIYFNLVAKNEDSSRETFQLWEEFKIASKNANL